MKTQSATDYILDLERRIEALERVGSGGGGGVSVDGTPEDKELLQFDSVSGTWKPKQQEEIDIFGGM